MDTLIRILILCGSSIAIPLIAIAQTTGSTSGILITAFPNANANGALDAAVGKVVKQIIKDDQCAHE